MNNKSAVGRELQVSETELITTVDQQRAYGLLLLLLQSIGTPSKTSSSNGTVPHLAETVRSRLVAIRRQAALDRWNEPRSCSQSRVGLSCSD